ncbi:hypothetical protein AB1N83_012622 [Pleurotus pulmonarius]
MRYSTLVFSLILIFSHLGAASRVPVSVNTRRTMLQTTPPARSLRARTTRSRRARRRASRARSADAARASHAWGSMHTRTRRAYRVSLG